VDRDAAGLGEGERFLDLPSLEVFLAQGLAQDFPPVPALTGLSGLANPRERALAGFATAFKCWRLCGDCDLKQLRVLLLLGASLISRRSK
jgi:hypothetical protein